MPITIKHGAELEGKGLAFGAASQAAYAKQQRKREKDAEDKAKKLGNISSVLSTAGAVATFIPGLQPVGVGLSIAGGALGQMAGGRGGVAGKTIAATAQGISQIYQSQAAKVQARADSFEDWKKRTDYTDEVSHIRKREELDGELAVRNQTYTTAMRQETSKFQNRRDAVWEATGMHTQSDEELLKIKADPRHPKFSTVTAASNKVQELANLRDKNIQKYQEAFELDPATTALEAKEKMEKEAAQAEKQAADQLKAVKTQEAAAQANFEKQSKAIVTTTQSIAGVEEELSTSAALDDDDEKKLDPGALTAKKNELRMLHAVRDLALEGVKRQKKVVYGSDDATFIADKEAWVKQWAIREAGPDADEGILLYYETQAAELFDSIAASGDRESTRELMEQMSHVATLNEFGIPIQEQHYMFGQGRSEAPPETKKQKLKEKQQLAAEDDFFPSYPSSSFGF